MTSATETRLLLLTLQPNTWADAERMESGLRQFAAEDPTLSIETDGPTGMVTIGTIGELQLEIVVDRLKREFQVEAGVGRPRVAYKRVITQTADGPDATPALLEPIMRVDVTVPFEYAADVIGDLAARRGTVQSLDTRDGTHLVHAIVPLAKLFGYATGLRERTRGRGNCSFQFDSYQPVREGSGPTDDDREALVRVPLQPAPSSGSSGVALPEPDDEGPEV